MLIKIIILVLLTFILLVGIHEAGHFLAARMFGVKVKRISFGFGKVLWRWKGRLNTEYVISLIPLGGYVQLLDTREEPQTKEQIHAFDKQSRIKQLIILVAGSFANFFLAFLLYWGVYSYGILLPAPIIAEVTPNSIVANANIHGMQQIISLDKISMHDWYDVLYVLLMNYGTASKLEISLVDLKTKNISQRTLRIKNWNLDAPKTDLLNSLGIKPLTPGDKRWSRQFFYLKDYSISKALMPGLRQTFSVIHINTIVLWKILTGILSVKVISGPIMILESVVFASKQGILIFSMFIAFLSASLGFMNLLPWPGLDGGKILFLLIESITRHKISYAWEFLLTRLGLIFLLVFVAQTVIWDLMRLFA